MSSYDDYVPRSSRRDVPPRYDDGPGLTFPDEDAQHPATRHSRNDKHPPGGARDVDLVDDLPRRKRDVDPRDLERPPRDYDSNPPRRSNMTATRRSPASDDDVDRPRKRDGGVAYGRSKGYREPVPEPEGFYKDRRLPRERDHPSRRARDYDDYSPEPIRRSKSTREPDRRRRDDYHQAEPRPRRYDDRYGDRDKGYRSDGRDGYARRRDDDRYRSSRRDDYGYNSDRGSRRDRDRDRDRHADRDRDYRDRDRRDRDHDREKPKKKGFDIKDVNKLYEQGQKHYKTVAPLIEKVAKMYMDSKGSGGR